MNGLLRQSASTVLILSATVAVAMVAPGQLTPPAPVEVTDVPFPTVGPATVAVSLLATIGVDGRVSDIQPVDTAGSTPRGDRYAGTLVGYEQNSLDALKRWKFAPAIDSSTQKPVPVPASVTFLYQRQMGLEELPTLNKDRPARSDYVPPMLREARPLPQYPWNSVGVGAVVLVLEVREDGSVAEVKNIRSVPSLDEPSSNAVKNWLFVPARYLGKPVRSTATVAIVYLYRINID
ncbi:MAG: hypothetical protein DMG13_30175 [Acidobacteria bacterium]|nr:MAG: hypothetical protein DMG13_30175 [Acidobacteriota bacterium]